MPFGFILTETWNKLNTFVLRKQWTTEPMNKKKKIFVEGKVCEKLSNVLPNNSHSPILGFVYHLSIVNYTILLLFQKEILIAIVFALSFADFHL